MIGAVLGNYRITAVLNTGGMGSVYRAQHELLDRPAAIKLLRPELTENDELVQRFFNEAKAATAIRHPGIIEVYDFGYTDDGHAYLVMEFLDGMPLSRAIAERGRFAEGEAAQIARNIASALKAAHAKGIIHRDLKPDNIFVVPDPDGRESRVKVLDFGIAKLANPPTSDRRRTQTGVLMGTPKYMAPEQAREAGTIDHRADLYSLGCILYELLVGEPPFLAEGAGEIIAMQLFTEVEPPSRRIPISPEMEQLVMGLLAKEPGERPESAAQVMDALVAIGARMSGSVNAVATQPSKLSAQARAHMVTMDTLPATPSAQITIAPPPAPTAVPGKRQRSPLPLVLGGLALAIAGGVVAFYLSRGAGTPAPPTPSPAPSPSAPSTPSAPAPAVEPIAAPAPAPAVEPTPAPAVDADVGKKPAVKTGAKLDKPAPKPKTETKTEPKTDPKTEPKTDTKTETQIDTKPQTDKGSPVELDIGDGPRTPKAP